MENPLQHYAQEMTATLGLRMGIRPLMIGGVLCWKRRHSDTSLLQNVFTIINTKSKALIDISANEGYT